MRTAAMASAALRRVVLASSHPSILSRAVSAGPVLSRWPDLSVYRHPVSRPFPLAFDLCRGYAGGRGGRVPDDEIESDYLVGEGKMDDHELSSDDVEIWGSSADEEEIRGSSSDDSSYPTDE